VLLCDEFARLGVQGRAALELLALGREFGKAVILATQGPSDLGELGPHALDQAAQDAGWSARARMWCAGVRHDRGHAGARSADGG
jgi:hypothetical protein